MPWLYNSLLKKIVGAFEASNHPCGWPKTRLWRKNKPQKNLNYTEKEKGDYFIKKL